MPVREKPPADRNRHAAQNQQLVPDDHRWKHHECETADRDGRARRHATNEQLERRIKDGCQAEQEHGNADPDDAFQAGEFRAVFASRVLRNYG